MPKQHSLAEYVTAFNSDGLWREVFFYKILNFTAVLEHYHKYSGKM